LKCTPEKDIGGIAGLGGIDMAEKVLNEVSTTRIAEILGIMT
jgi:hypothetical protein